MRSAKEVEYNMFGYICCFANAVLPFVIAYGILKDGMTVFQELTPIIYFEAFAAIFSLLFATHKIVTLLKSEAKK